MYFINKKCLFVIRPLLHILWRHYWGLMFKDLMTSYHNLFFSQNPVLFQYLGRIAWVTWWDIWHEIQTLVLFCHVRRISTYDFSPLVHISARQTATMFWQLLTPSLRNVSLAVNLNHHRRDIGQSCTRCGSRYTRHVFFVILRRHIRFLKNKCDIHFIWEKRSY